jgi:hypothetical protein
MMNSYNGRGVEEMMESAGAENRQYRRIYFPEELVISGVVAGLDTRAEFSVKVLNLSEGGLFFTLGREKGGCFKEKERILLLNLRGPDPFSISQQLNMEIKWVCDNEAMENIGYGCEFIEPPAGFLDQVRELVARFSTESMPNDPGS